jgi:hypothetical protein
MPEAHEFARPMMRTRASLQADPARRQLREEVQQAAARQPPAQNRPSGAVHGVHLEHRLREIESHRHRGQGEDLLLLA